MSCSRADEYRTPPEWPAGSSSAASTTRRRSSARRRTRATRREWFAGRGWDVRVVTTYPYYPEWRRRAGDPRFGYRIEARRRRDGVALPDVRPGGADRPEAARALRQLRRLQPAGRTRRTPPGGRTSSWWSRRRWRARRERCSRRASPGPPAGCTSRTTRWTSPSASGCCRRPPARRSSGSRAGSCARSTWSRSITEPMLAVAARPGRAAGAAGAPAQLGQPGRRAAAGPAVALPSFARHPGRQQVVLYTGNLGRKQGVALIADAARRSQDAGSPARVRRLRRRRRSRGARGDRRCARTDQPRCGCRFSQTSRSTNC